jgi:prophage antirepressor-like protein
VPAADVGDRAAVLELRDDAVKRRQPGRHQVRVVAGPEEPLAALEDVVRVLVPADAAAGARRLGDPRGV